MQLIGLRAILNRYSQLSQGRGNFLGVGLQHSITFAELGIGEMLLAHVLMQK